MTYYLWVWNDDLKRWEIVWSSENDLEVLARKSEIEADKKYTEINTDSTTPPESPLGTPTYNYTTHCSVDSSQTAGLSSKTEYSVGDTLPPSEAGTCYDSEGNMGYWVVDSKSVTYPEPKERPSGNVIYVVYKKDGKYTYSRILDKYLDTWQHQLLDGGYIEEFVDYKNTEEEAKELVNSLQPEKPEYHNRIYGTVKDKALGTPISLATVTFGGKTVYTGNDGKYEILDVWYSGEIVCQAYGYKTSTEFIEAPIEGDLKVDFELEKEKEGVPYLHIAPAVPPLQGMDKELLAANEIAKQQLDAAKTQGEIPEPAIETALRQVGLDDWADKYHEIYEWLNDNFGVEMPDPRDPTKKRKVIILTAGFAGGLGGLASKLGLNTAKGALTRAGGAIAATIGGLKASSILKGITGIVGTVVFAEFICEEAVQTAGMGVYMASQTRDPEVVRQALENYKNILNATKQIHDTVKYIDPIGSTFEAFFVASENNITNYEKLIDRLEEKKERQMTKTDILRAYREELIDEDTAKEKLRALNYSDEDIDVMLNLTAKEKLGKLKVTSKPTHAQIIINDNPVNLLTSETMELPPGTYAVTVSLEGYKIPDAKEVTIEEEGRAEVHFDLERMKIGYLSLRSRPSQAAIYINGVDTKLLTPQKFELEEGTYTITLKYKGYEDREIEVEIKENETVERFVRLVRKT